VTGLAPVRPDANSAAKNKQVFLMSWGGVRLSTLRTSATMWPILPAPDDEGSGDECGAVDGMRIGKGNPKYSVKTCPVPLRPPQIPHDLTWAQTRVAAVGSMQLTA
jgi:hypothetical protein